MGLDTTHDCWHGAYSAFMRWRREIARLCDIPLDKMQGYCDPREALSWDRWRGDPIVVLLDHSDCDGSIAAKDCGPLADRLQGILDGLPTVADPGHIGDWRDTTERFIAGLRRAAAAGEDVEFH